MIVVPATFKTVEFAHTFIQTVAHLRDSLNAAEDQIRQLRGTIEDLQTQMQNQVTATSEMQKLINQNIDAIETTKQIEEVYECLDLLDDRLLDLAKSEKTRKLKKKVRREAREIEALDKKNPNEEIFDNFIASERVFNHEGRVFPLELRKQFKDWYDTETDNLGDYPSNHELREYMCRNFYWDEGAWIKMPYLSPSA